MSIGRVRSIKHAQKESLIFHKIAEFFMRISQDEPELQTLYVSRVRLSPDKSNCTVFFHSSGGIQDFEMKRPKLVLYKPSMRTALANSLQSRYVPNLRFEYDAQFDKAQRVEDILSSLKTEDDNDQ